jgi:hypothetical protein
MIYDSGSVFRGSRKLEAFGSDGKLGTNQSDCTVQLSGRLQF